MWNEATTNLWLHLFTMSRFYCNGNARISAENEYTVLIKLEGFCISNKLMSLLQGCLFVVFSLLCFYRFPNTQAPSVLISH